MNRVPAGEARPKLPIAWWTWGAALGVTILGLVIASCARAPLRSTTPGGTEVGLASWYGPEFHGRPTSSGEIYDMHQLTAAHRQLPLGTWVMVTNLDTGRSVEVRINDRGPFVPDRILDVSYGAGKALGMIGPGVIPVRIAVTKAPTGEGSAPIASVRFTVQAGSFASVENARLLQRSLAETFSHVEVIPRTVGSETVFRVWVGDFRRRVDAQAVAERLAGRGLSVLVVERNR